MENKTSNAMNRLLLPVSAALLLCMAAGCNSVDCPMNNTVYTVYSLLKADATPDTLSDTLSIVTFRRTPDQDPVLINREYAASTLNVPISYSHPDDVLLFAFYNTDVSIDTIYYDDDTYALTTDSTYFMSVDTVTITKTDHPHFESVDCNPSFFHTITGVQHTRHMIDSIVVNNPEVNYDATKAHFLLYLKHRR